MKSFLVYKFNCAICSSSYISGACCHFKTRIEEHIKKDIKSHIFKHPHSTATCFDSYNSLSFKVIYKVSSKFDLKMKETLHISWTRPTSHPLTTSHFSCLLFNVFVYFFFFFGGGGFLFHLLFSSFLTLICYYFISL